MFNFGDFHEVLLIFFPSSAVLFLHPFIHFSNVVILANTSLFIVTFFWAILSTYMVSITYFSKRVIPKYISPPPSFSLFIWLLCETPHYKRSKLNSSSFSLNPFAFLYYLSHLMEPISTQVRSLEVALKSFLSLCQSLCHETLNISKIYAFPPFSRH